MNDDANFYVFSDLKGKEEESRKDEETEETNTEDMERRRTRRTRRGSTGTERKGAHHRT